jgi:gliding motility-associated-like protein
MKRRIIIIFIILLNYQAGAQSLPDNFNLIPNFDNELKGFSFTTFENSCWIRANYYGVKFIPTGSYTLDTINPSNRMTPIISKYVYLTLPTYINRYDNISLSYLDTIINQRWYAQTRLIKKLEQNKRYYFSVFVNARIDSGFSGNEFLNGFLPNLGFFFSENASYDTLNIGQLELNPQFKITNMRAKGANINTYKKYEYSFIATGKEQYLIIGNFEYFKNFDTLFGCKNCYQLKNDTIKDMQAVIGIDGLVLTSDTSILPISAPEFKLGNDTTLCYTDTFRLSAQPFYSTYYWNTGETTQTILVNNRSDNYYCTATLGCGNYSDTINITFCDTTTSLNTVYLPNAFSPNNDSKNDEISFNNPKIIPISLSILNRFGNEVYKSKSYFTWDGYFNGLPCAVGVYYYSLTYKIPITNEIKIKNGDITLLK